jgi:hypothetical protein
MKTKTIPAMIGSLLLGTVLSMAGPTYTIWTYKGVITDSMCGMDIAPGKKCVEECARGGAKYALQSGRNIYRLIGNKKTLSEFVGQEVKISGTLFSKKDLKVVSISQTK